MTLAGNEIMLLKTVQVASGMATVMHLRTVLAVENAHQQTVLVVSGLTTVLLL